MTPPPFTLAPLGHWVSNRLQRRSLPVTTLASENWEIAPAEHGVASAAIFLPGQLERIGGWAFADRHPGPGMAGGPVVHAATRGYLIRDVWLIDSTLYKGQARTWLAPAHARLTSFQADEEIERAALYCSVIGNMYFGSWLVEDCVTYPLACREGMPVTLARTDYPHARQYENRLGMRPRRVRSAWFRELVLFDDAGQNDHKHHRFRALSRRLLDGIKPVAYPGVFILRGTTGAPRLLENELELAEYLAIRRGFRVVDPESEDVQDILAICAGADVVMGVEGSQLAHGVVTLRAGGTIFALQPPKRFVRIYKDMADRDRQHFAFVVGHAGTNGFWIDPTEVERTLDLLPR